MINVHTDKTSSRIPFPHNSSNHLLTMHPRLPETNGRYQVMSQTSDLSEDCWLVESNKGFLN